MQLERFHLTPAQFNAIPDAERALMVLLAHGLNEVNALEKLVAMSMNFERGHVSIERAQSGQAMILVRTLAGKLHEIYKLIEVCFSKTKLAKTYRDTADAATITALDKINKYFGPGSKVSKIRNQQAFHYIREQGLTKVDADQPEADLALYLHSNNANSFYQFAELVMTIALTELFPAPPLEPGQPFTPVNEGAESHEEDVLLTILAEMRYATHLVNAFSHGMIFSVIEKFVGEAAIKSTRLTIDIGETVDVSAVHIPFFIKSTKAD